MRFPLFTRKRTVGSPTAPPFNMTHSQVPSQAPRPGFSAPALLKGNRRCDRSKLPRLPLPGFYCPGGVKGDIAWGWSATRAGRLIRIISSLVVMRKILEEESSPALL